MAQAQAELFSELMGGGNVCPHYQGPFTLLLLPGHVGKAFSSCHLEQFQPGTWKKKAQGQVSSLLNYLGHFGERLPFARTLLLWLSLQE